MPVSATRYFGTLGNDLFELDLSALANAQIAADIGSDTLRIMESGGYAFTSTLYRSISGIDAFDFSAHQTGILEVRLTSGIMSQSDAARITIVSGAAGIDLLRVGSSVGGTVFVAGSGTVHLDDTTDNFVTIADGSSVHVMGGAGGDTIIAAATGSVLDGGAGSDTLIAGNGADTIRFGIGDRADVVQGFDLANDIIVVEGLDLHLMSEIRGRLSNTAAGARLDLGNGDTLTLAGIDAEALTAANFQGITEGAPTIVIEPGTTAAMLNAIIANAGPGSTILLAAGVHVFDRQVLITHDNVTFQGAGEGLTTVIFAYPEGTGGNGIVVRGGIDTPVGTASADAARGAMSITVSSVVGLRAGDVIRISQDNDTAYLTAHGWQDADAALLSTHPFREMLVAIDHIDGNTIHLTRPLAFDFAAGATRIAEADLVTGVHLSDMTVTYSLGATNPFDFVNTHPEFDGAAAVMLDGTRDAVVERITVLDAASHAVDVQTSLHATVDDIFVDGAHNLGTDGNGYGLQIYETFDSTFTGLEIYDMRHAVLFSAWDAEVGNTVHVVDTNRDINFHGSEDLGNVVIVDRASLAYDRSQNTGTGNGYWPLVSDGGASHTTTDIYGGNSVVFGYARGFDSPDVVYGRDGGSYLNGMGGRDVLVGGNGQDVIIGSVGKDLLTGGAGSDLFVFRVGDGYDVITDFNPRAGGDRIVISGNAAIDSYADLAISNDAGSAVIRYGSNSTITLSGVLVSALNVNCFVFDPSAELYNSLA